MHLKRKVIVTMIVPNVSERNVKQYNYNYINYILDSIDCIVIASRMCVAVPWKVLSPMYQAVNSILFNLCYCMVRWELVARQAYLAMFYCQMHQCYIVTK